MAIGGSIVQIVIFVFVRVQEKKEGKQRIGGVEHFSIRLIES